MAWILGAVIAERPSHNFIEYFFPFGTIGLFVINYR
jgi:hypothetical protein